MSASHLLTQVDTQASSYLSHLLDMEQRQNDVRVDLCYHTESTQYISMRNFDIV